MKGHDGTNSLALPEEEFSGEGSNTKEGSLSQTFKVGTRSLVSPKISMKHLPISMQAEHSRLNSGSSSTRKGSVATQVSESEVASCASHSSSIFYICVHKHCYKEMCGQCLLEHKHHINSIKYIHDVFGEAWNQSSHSEHSHTDKSVVKLTDGCHTDTLNELDSIMNKLQESFLTKVQSLRNLVMEQSHQVIDRMELRNYLLNTTMQAREDPGSVVINRELLVHLKEFLSQGASPNFRPNEVSKLCVEVGVFKERFSTLFADGVRFSKSGFNYETTSQGVPNILHWFEWGKKKLFMYDPSNNHSRVIDLMINFKIPSFSRSVLTNTGHIYLMGGEEPELTTKDDIYMLGLGTNMQEKQTLEMRVVYGLTQRKMLHRKYDFTCCALDECIYIISGRDCESGVTASCEKYNGLTDSWTQIADVNHKRFAATCCAVKDTRKIYLFGGRSEEKSQMVSLIEEYDIDTDKWKIVELKNPEMWIPVEVCAMIQIDDSRILLFGGSDAQIKDTTNSYIFDTREYTLEQTSSLRRPQVFVFAPILYGRQVYAIGNEYYVKNRSLNRFSLDTLEWDIVF